MEKPRSLQLTDKELEDSNSIIDRDAAIARTLDDLLGQRAKLAQAQREWWLKVALAYGLDLTHDSYALDTSTGLVTYHGPRERPAGV